jgi:hypothetical protein
MRITIKQMNKSPKAEAIVKFYRRARAVRTAFYVSMAANIGLSGYLYYILKVKGHA